MSSDLGLYPLPPPNAISYLLSFFAGNLEQLQLTSHRLSDSIEAQFTTSGK
jgi:hypothetical protein